MQKKITGALLPLFYSPLMVNPGGSRESGYRFVRDFIIEREGEEFLVVCYFVVLVVFIAQLFIYPFS